MFGTTAAYLREQLRRRTELIPVGITWASMIAVDATEVIGGVIATLQRPTADLPVSLTAIAISISPLLTFFFLNTKLSPALMWATWSTATALMLFGTSTPIHADFAPAWLVLMVLAVVALTSVSAGLLAALSAVVMLLAAAALHRLDVVALYVGFIGASWLLGYLMRSQRMLLAEQIQAQKMLAEHAAADERRRIAREIHDVIAHSLSVTLLHVTGARRGLQQDRDIEDAVEALEQAEQLGRQAMADIRRTVGLLDRGPMKITPEPAIHDIATLVRDFERAGLAVSLSVDGPTERVAGVLGLALYRIAQESLANIAKHAPDSKAAVVLQVSANSVKLAVTNKLPAAVTAAPSSEGRGLRGMRQRVELLGGAINAGPTDDGWAVRADMPLQEGDTSWRPWWCKQ